MTPHAAADCTPACTCAGPLPALLEPWRCARCGGFMPAHCAGVASFPTPANPEARPLRVVVGSSYERGSRFEVLECGHVQIQKSDIYGPTNAYRRRCLGCRLLARAVADAWAWRMADTMPDSAQSRRDALADAETLRRAHPPKSWKKTSVGQAAKYGARIAVTRPWLGDPNGSSSAHDAICAARAAFRACPLLREP